jgi:hypothetical protein
VAVDVGDDVGVGVDVGVVLAAGDWSVPPGVRE